MDESRKKSPIACSFMPPSDGVGFHNLLHLIKCGLINDWRVFAVKPFALVTYFTKVRSVLQEMGQGPVGQFFEPFPLDEIAPNGMGSCWY